MKNVKELVHWIVYGIAATSITYLVFPKISGTSFTGLIILSIFFLVVSFDYWRSGRWRMY